MRTQESLGLVFDSNMLNNIYKTKKTDATKPIKSSKKLLLTKDNKTTIDLLHIPHKQPVNSKNVRTKRSNHPLMSHYSSVSLKEGTGGSEFI